MKNAAVSVRSEGIACDAGHGLAGVKRLCNVWLLAAHQVLETLGLTGRGGASDELDLYVATDGELLAVTAGQAPENAVYVCHLRRGIDPVVVAARLRHVASRWRREYPASVQDND